MGGQGRLRRGRLKRELAVEKGLRDSELAPNPGHKYTSTGFGGVGGKFFFSPSKTRWKEEKTNAILNGSSILPFFRVKKKKFISQKGHTTLSVIYTSLKIIFQTISNSRFVQGRDALVLWWGRPTALQNAGLTRQANSAKAELPL